MDNESIQQKADQCVKCGLCLPHCPTYRLYRDEAESPRGRIALLQGVTGGFLEPDAALIGHLDNCLQCRRCEGACPSGVEYAAMLDEARTELTAHRHSRLADLLTSSSLLDVALGVGRGVGKLLPKGEGDSLLAKLIPLIPRRKPFSLKTSLYPALAEPRGRVLLFAGCVGRHTDAAALEALVAVLTLQGYSVSVPPGQGCCGAIHAHSGDTEKADSFVAASRQAFAGDADAILVTSSGCGQQLQDSIGAGTPVYEATAFLAEHIDLPEIPPEKLEKTASYLPCSLHAMKQADAVRKLLASVSDGNLPEIEGLGCCGGAGMHMLTHPQMARDLAAPIVENIRLLGIETLLTTNSGCALNIGQALHKAGLSVTVMHPLEWLQKQLEIAS